MLKTQFHTVFKIINNVNGKYYIGKHSTNNLNDNYMGSGDLIKLAIRKYGIKEFKKEIIFRARTEQIAYWIEGMIVDKEFINSQSNYNISLGGYGAIMLGRKHSDKTKNLIGKSSKNSTKETREKISQALKGRIGYFKGHVHTTETKNKIRKTLSVPNNTVWVYNLDLKKSNKIKKGKLPEYINLGWLKGRKMKFD